MPPQNVPSDPSGCKTIAVVVSWNLRESVLLCLESLKNQVALDGVTVVDNASTDGTPDAVEATYPEVRLVRNSRNIGFAAAANKGISMAIEEGADFVLLANSDVVAPPGAVARLVRAAREEDAGAAGAKILREDNPRYLDGAWGVINWRNFISRVEGEGKADGPEYSSRKIVDYPLGTFLLLNVEALKKVGMLDESYFAYHEEMELCHRLKKAGYGVIYEPVGIYHGVRKSLRAAGAELAREYLLARNSARFAAEHGSFAQKAKFWCFVTAAAVLKTPAAMIKGGLDAHKANVQGWLDGLRGRPFDYRLKSRYNL